VSSHEEQIVATQVAIHEDKLEKPRSRMELQAPDMESTRDAQVQKRIEPRKLCEL